MSIAIAFLFTEKKMFLSAFLISVHVTFAFLWEIFMFSHDYNSLIVPEYIY